MRRYLRSVMLVATAVALAACGDSTGPQGPVAKPESQLDFVLVRSDAPRLTTTDTSFWAVAGEGRRLEIMRQAAVAGAEGESFLSFEVKSGSLLRRPDGTMFQPGDSVLIRVVVDTTKILAEFRPSGLEFNPADPAELKIEYGEAEDQYLMPDTESRIDLWRQELPGDPWTRLGSVKVEDLNEIEAKLTGFTRFALAIGR